MEKNMKKFLKITAVVLVALTMTAMLVACGQDYSEVAGTYEISILTGEVNGVHVTQDNYEYFRIILTKDGNATVESKASGGGAEYKATGTFTYADGKIAQHVTARLPLPKPTITKTAKSATKYHKTV